MSLNKLKNVSILEIGCAYGTSSMIIANALNKLPTKNKTYDVIDPSQDDYWNGVGHYNLERVINTDTTVEYVSEISDVALPYLFDKNKTYNLIFIDGAHDYVKMDILY